MQRLARVAVVVLVLGVTTVTLVVSTGSPASAHTTNGTAHPLNCPYIVGTANGYTENCAPEHSIVTGGVTISFRSHSQHAASSTEKIQNLQFSYTGGTTSASLCVRGFSGDARTPVDRYVLPSNSAISASGFSVLEKMYHRFDNTGVENKPFQDPHAYLVAGATSASACAAAYTAPPPPPDHDATGLENFGPLAAYFGSCDSVRPSILLGIAKVESDYGADPDSWVANAAGALGPYQFIESSWALYGADAGGRYPDGVTPAGDVPTPDGQVDRLTNTDSMFAARALLIWELRENSGDLYQALLDYNGATSSNGYPEKVYAEANAVREAWDGECADVAHPGDSGDTPTAPDSDGSAAGCAPSGWALLNPAAYVKGTICIFRWAFFPQIGPVTAAWESLTATVETSIVGAIAAPLRLVFSIPAAIKRNLVTEVPAATCAGPQLDVNIHSGGEDTIPLEINPLDACGNKAEMAKMVRLAGVVSLVLGAGATAASMISWAAGKPAPKTPDGDPEK